MDMSEYNSFRQVGASALFKLITKYEKTSAMLFATIIMFWAQRYISTTKFHGDADRYWYFSSFIWNFSFPQIIRGYFYPFLISPSKLIFESFPETGYLSLYLMQALVFAFSLAILLPYVFIKLIGGKTSLARRLVPPLMVAIFFPALIAYPLSDLPAICLMLACVAMTLFASGRGDVFYTAVIMTLAGVAIYGAYNTRTIYLFTAIILLILIPAVIFSKSSFVQKFIATSAFIFGAALAATPQALINAKYLDSYTPLVVSTINNTSLFANQLKWGVTIQRYETGYDTKSGAVFGIYYLDPVGEQIFEKYNMGDSQATVLSYFNIVFSEPASFLKIYMKHFINGLDVRDDDTYTRTRSKENNIRSLASISTSIFGLICLLFLTTKSATAPNEKQPRATIFRIMWIAVILLPVLAMIPGAIETRFFLPLHLMAYCAIAFGLSGSLFEDISRTTKILMVVMFFAIITACYFSASQSIANPVYEIPNKYMK